MDDEAGSVWAPTRAFGRAILLTGVLMLVAVLLGRLDLIVIAAPFALGIAWSLRQRPTADPGIALGDTDETAAEGGAVHTVVTVTNPSGAPFDLAVARLAYSPWLALRQGHRPYATDLAAGQRTEIRLEGMALRWGHHGVGPAIVYAVAGGGLLLSERIVTTGTEIKVNPQLPPFGTDDTMPRSSGLVGIHRSRRPGEGGELAGVRRYSPGDRLRRVDWRVTLRARELHVAQTLSDRDAEVVVLLDVLHEAGQSGGIKGAASVVDTSVRAAAAIADYYLRQGDRVSMIEYSGHPRHLRSAGGRRQLQTILDWLLRTRATAGAGDPPVFGIEPHLIPNSALVVVLTPMLGPQSAEMIATISRAGRVVVAVDTLGALARRPIAGTQWTKVAQQLWALERDNTIGQLREVGVPVAAWAGEGTLDQVLRDMTRMASAPRIGVR